MTSRSWKYGECRMFSFPYLVIMLNETQRYNSKSRKHVSNRVLYVIHVILVLACSELGTLRSRIIHGLQSIFIEVEVGILPLLTIGRILVILHNDFQHRTGSTGRFD